MREEGTGKTREEMEREIKELSSFYRFVDFRGHTEEQVKAILERVQRKTGPENKPC